MTNKIQRTAGADFSEIEIDGQTYKMSPLAFGAYGEMEAYVCSLRSCPIDIAASKSSGLSVTNQQLLFDAAIRAATFAKIVPAVEMANFEKSVAGLAWKFWKTLSPNHEEIATVNDAAILITKAGADRLLEIRAKLIVATGESSLKK